MICAAAFSSCRPRLRPPVMLNSTPLAPLIETSSSGLEIAICGRIRGAVRAGAAADRHQRRAGLRHDLAHVREVEVDLTRQRDDLADALDALQQHVVGRPEGFLDGGLLVADGQQPVVGDDDQRVDLVLEPLDAFLGIARGASSPRSRTAW